MYTRVTTLQVLEVKDDVKTNSSFQLNFLTLQLMIMMQRNLFTTVR